MSKPRKGQRDGAGRQARPAAASPPPPSEPEVYERLYGVTLTEAERRLLSTSGELLGPYERQAAFLLKMALRAERCPACQYVLCPRSAWTGVKLPDHEVAQFPGRPDLDRAEPVDTSWAADGTDGQLFACGNCRVRLIHHLGITQADHWFTLAPGQTVEVT